MTSARLIDLASGSLRVSIAPSSGGTIARFDLVLDGEKHHILRACDNIPETPLEAACFPLVPYCNRIRNGRFTFRGREVSIPRNLDVEATPLHGHGWMARWEVVREESEEAELLYRHEADDWPWRYEARQLFQLGPEGLTLTISCRNLSDDPMPGGLGLHPYFPCDGETRLDTRVTHAWTIDDKVLPVEKVPATGRFDLTDRLVCGQDLDNGFAGWEGTARIHTPGQPFAIEMSSDDAGFFQLYSPPSGKLFVAEPVTHANAALNEPEERWPELGLRVLEAGEEMTLTAHWRILLQD